MEEKEIQEKIKKVVVGFLGIDEDECQPENTFKQMSADDLDMVDITIELEKMFDITILEVDEYPDCYPDLKFGELVEIVKNKLS